MAVGRSSLVAVSTSTGAEHRSTVSRAATETNDCTARRIVVDRRHLRHPTDVLAGALGNRERLGMRRMTLELVSQSGFVEYYDPRTGEPLGVSDFSWSAALTLDLLLRS